MAKRKNPKGRRHRRNPIEDEVKNGLQAGIALGLGAVVTRAVMNNLPLPASVQGGVGEAAVSAGVAIGLGMAAQKVDALKKYADDIRNGGIAMAVYKVAAPTALPMLAFTAAAQAHAAVQTQLQAAQQAAAATVATVAAGATAAPAAPATSTSAVPGLTMPPSGTSGMGDAFILSRGGITTQDRAPRDTAALAGVGDAYAPEPKGFGGAPNGLRAPWGGRGSIYSNR
jgi:hypothetical protein